MSDTVPVAEKPSSAGPWPTLTVIIAARPGEKNIQAVAASLRLEYPVDKLEIIVARGTQPSIQRNAALKVARGELVYFLDDDSLPFPGNLQHVVPLFRDSQVQMVGGPNLCPPEAPLLEQVFAATLGSWLAFGPSRARYSVVGTVRASSEKELILCNLIARRQSLVDLGGFDESLYPNEENALMDTLQERGGQLLYDPAFAVQRRPRRSLKSFAKMLLTYGRGRAEQFRLHPTVGSAPNLVPPLFCLYLATLPLWHLPGWPRFVLGLDLWPLGGYALALAVQTISSSRRNPGLTHWLALPLIVMTHLLYGLGFWRGLVTRLKPSADRQKIPVFIERVRSW